MKIINRHSVAQIMKEYGLNATQAIDLITNLPDEEGEEQWPLMNLLQRPTARLGYYLIKVENDAGKYYCWMVGHNNPKLPQPAHNFPTIRSCYGRNPDIMTALNRLSEENAHVKTSCTFIASSDTDIGFLRQQLTKQHGTRFINIKTRMRATSKPR